MHKIVPPHLVCNEHDPSRFKHKRLARSTFKPNRGGSNSWIVCTLNYGIAKDYQSSVLEISRKTYKNSLKM